MKKIYLVGVLLIGLLYLSFTPSNTKTSFSNGEYLKFKIFYNLFPFTAGHAELNVSDVTFNGVPHYYVEGRGRTQGLFRLFKVEDLYASYINKNNNLPSKSIRNIYEGGYKRDVVQYFNHDNNEVKVVNNINKTTANYKSTENIQDMISAFYYLRQMNFKNKKDGDVVNIDIFMDEEIYNFKMKILGREKVSTKFGKINCLKLRPYVQSGRIFKAKESVTFWITDDENLVPVEIKADLLVGSLKAQLIEFKNLSNPINFE